MSEDRIGYDRLVQRAMKTVVRGALEHAGKEGLPGEHHFYITFETTYPGVTVGDELSRRFPETMTIVLQHRFEDLVLDDVAVHVTLYFSGKPTRLSIPIDAISKFVDPSVSLALELLVERENEPPAPDTEPPEDAGNVVSLDRFRNRT